MHNCSQHFYGKWWSTFNNDVTAFSDARLKENVSTIENALDKVDNLRGVNYTHKATGDEKIGVIAQEVEEILPQVVLHGR